MGFDDVDQQEEQWATQLTGRSLVTEADIDGEVALCGLETLARRYNRLVGARSDRARLLQMYPATVLVGMTAVGSLHYDDGTYWPRFQEQTGLESKPWVVDEFSKAFRSGLRRFKLSRFDLPQNNIGEILMHAGVPASGLEGLYTLLAERDAKRNGELTGADFCDWLRLKVPDVQSARSGGIDAPTWRFLTLGREIASDLVDRLLDVLDAAKAPSEELQRAIEELPRALAEQTTRLLGENRLQSAGKRGKRYNAYMPDVVYMYGQTQILLPNHDGSTAEAVYWTIDLGANQRVVSIRAPMPGDSPRWEHVPVLAPVERVHVSMSCGAREQSWGIEVVSPTNQVLAFDVDSRRLIRAGSELPSGVVWLAFPSEDRRAPETALEVDGNLDIREVADTPMGWSGWAFIRCDLSHVRRLCLKSTREWRWISRIVQSRLTDEYMVPFILSGDEQPVFGRAPRLILPPDARAGETFQTITVSRPNGDVVTTREVRTRNEEQEINPWEGIARPILGAWDIQVRGGGLGRSKRFHLHIAEGCEVIATPAPRYFTEDGVLQPAAVQIRFNGARSDLMLGPGQANGTHQLRTDRDNLTVSVDVDCMWTRIEQPEKLRTIVYETCRVDVEDLAATNLTLHIPRLRSATIELVAGDAVVQSVNKAPNRQGHIALHLGQFRDTTRQYGSAELWCHWDQDRQLVARFRPRRVLTALTVQDDVLQVDRVHESLDVELELALDCAPWYPAARLRVPSGTDQLELPSQLRGRGPMTIVAREYDPWRRAVAHDAAQVSDENIFEIDALVDVTLETVEDEFLRWIKSGGECPDSYEALEFGITHYAAIARARRGARPEVLYRSFANATHEFERGFIETAIQSGWNLAVHGRLFAEGFPATAPAAQRPVFERTWEVSPYLGLLESGARRKDPRLHVQLLHTLGESALSIVETGNDPDAAVGRFAQEAAILAHWPLQRIDDLRAFWLCQSGAFLSPNLRLARSLQLFVNRNALLLVPLIELGDQILHGAKQSLCRIARHDAVAVIAERETRSGWQNLPALSLSLAFTARIAAREDGVTNDAYQRYRDFYADLASLAPEIVEQDLVLAELWLGR